MVFRNAEEYESEAIMNLYRAAVGKPFCTWDETYPGMFEIWGDLSNRTLFVLEEEKELIGAISIVPENELDHFEHWEINKNAREFARVVLRPDHQHQGLSVFLVEGIIQEMKKQHVAAIHIAVAKENIPALKLYKRTGFCIRGEADLFGHHFCLCEKIL